jgi:hypothetical protein
MQDFYTSGKLLIPFCTFGKLMLPIRKSSVLPAIENKRLLRHQRQRDASSRGKLMGKVTLSGDNRLREFWEFSFNELSSMAQPPRNFRE